MGIVGFTTSTGSSMLASKTYLETTLQGWMAPKVNGRMAILVVQKHFL